MSSSVTGRGGRGRYHELEIGEAETEAVPLSSPVRARRSRFNDASRLYSTTWGHRGFVEQFRRCLTPRTGVVMISLMYLLCSAFQSLIAKGFRKLQEDLDMSLEVMRCTTTRVVDTDICETLLQLRDAVEHEHKTDPHATLTMVRALIGMSLLGFVAAMTEKPVAAKLHMVAYLVLFVHEVFLAIRAAVDTSRFKPLSAYLVQLPLMALCFQVLRSFHRKCAVAEAARLTAAAPLEVKHPSTLITQPTTSD